MDRHKETKERLVSEQQQPAYWIIVGSPENVAKTRELGFTVQGVKSRHRKKAERMKPGDKLVYYVTGRKAFAAVSTITSPSFESHEPIWRSGNPKKAEEDYPYRVHTEPEIILDEGSYVDAEPVARQMAYVAKWPAANWTLAFQGNVHEISAEDFALIRDAVADAAGVAAS
jgi:predicted RNA-binding protein